MCWPAAAAAACMELTDRRAKPAVYFGGKSRIIDFALSNALNSGIRRIGVATQYKAHSLIRHLQRGWNFLRARAQRELRHPAGQPARLGDAVVRGHRRRGLPEHRHHRELRPRIHRHPGRRPHLQDGLRADAAAARRRRRRRHGRLPRGAAHGGDRLRRHACRRRATASSRFVEKPAGSAGDARQARTWRSPAWASTSSRRKFLFDQLRRDAADPNSSRDFGKDIIPYIVKHGKAVAHRFAKSCVRVERRGRGLLARRRHGRRLLGGQHRPDRHRAGSSTSTTATGRSGPIAEITPPAKFVHDEEGRRGSAVTSLVSGGCIVSGATLRASLLFTGVRVHSYSHVENAVILPVRRDRPRGAAQQCRDRPRRAHSRRAWSSARIPSSTPSASAAPTAASA